MPDNENIMNASEAKQMAQLAMDRKGSEINKKLEKTLQSIKKAAENGEFELSLFDRLQSKIIDRLTALGYKVKTGYTPRNEGYTDITWK